MNNFPKKGSIPNVVAIDPDLNASGVAAWSNTTNNWHFAQKVSIESILECIKHLPASDTIIYVEAGWMISKANFRGGNYRVSQAMARKVGENHATGKIISKILSASGYKVIEFSPLKKGIFKTSDGWTEAGRRYVEKESGLKHRMNDDVRDAIYTVLHFR